MSKLWSFLDVIACDFLGRYFLLHEFVNRFILFLTTSFYACLPVIIFLKLCCGHSGNIFSLSWDGLDTVVV